jgi:hypothetical protein
MKIAFDVQGTLVGPKGDILTQLINELKAQGHEIFIWSSNINMAIECGSKIGISNDYCLNKKYLFDYHNENELMDIAIDDDLSLKLLTRKTYSVYKLPNTYKELKDFFIQEKVLK